MNQQLIRKLLKLALPLLALTLVSIGAVGCDTDTAQQTDSTLDVNTWQQEREQNHRVDPEPSPQKVEPISPYYGDRHGEAIGH
jgi:hypothetical protein